MKKLILATLVLAGIYCLQSYTEAYKKKDSKKSIKVLKNKYSLIKAGKVKLINGDEVAVQAFIISPTEISVSEYRMFLNDLQKQGKMDLYNKAMYDSTLWVQPGIFSYKQFQSFYFSHPYYQNYPIVGITREGAQLYCDWVTEKINDNLPNDQKLTFRLPLEAEFLKVAQGDDASYSYTWKSNFTTNKQGKPLANFLQYGDQSIGRDDQGNLVVHTVNYAGNELDGGQSTDVLAPVKSYFPNEFGVYNLNGNVAEMLADRNEVIGGSWLDTGYDIRSQSLKPYVGASLIVGFRIVATVSVTNQPFLFK